MLSRPNPTALARAHFDFLREGHMPSAPSLSPLSSAYCFNNGRASGAIEKLGLIPQMMIASRLLKPGPNPEFTLINVPTPIDLKHGDALVEVRDNGICGSDKGGVRGDTGRRNAAPGSGGLTLGHEFSGRIVARLLDADEEHHLPLGQRVVGDSSHYCGSCENCRAGFTNTCFDMKVRGCAPDDGSYILQGAMAQYIAVPMKHLFPLPDGVSYEAGALAEPIAVTLQAIQRAQEGRIQLTQDTPVLVLGAGLIGSLLIQTLESFGVKCIMAVDTNTDCLDFARQVGARYTHRNSPFTIPGTVKDQLTCFKAHAMQILSAFPSEGKLGTYDFKTINNAGFPVVFEVAGLLPTVGLASFLARKGGTVVQIGNESRESPPTNQLNTNRGLTWLYSCAAAPADYVQAIQLLQRGAIRASQMITHRVPLEGVEDAFKNPPPGARKIMVKCHRPTN